MSAIKADLETDDQPEARQSTAKPTAVSPHDGGTPAAPEVSLNANLNAVNSGSWFPNREQDPNHGVLMSLLEEDMRSDNKQSIRVGTLEQTARQAPLTQTSLSTSQQGAQSAAESISPRYSSQQSQGTNIDWDSDAAEVSSSHRQPASVQQPEQQQQVTVASNATASAAEVPTAARSALAANDGVQAAASNQEQLPAHHGNAVAAPSAVGNRVSMSKSGQQASAMQADVQGMAPNPGAIMIGEEGGGRPWLKRAFSMVDQENMNMGIDMNQQMDSLDKVRRFCSQKVVLQFHLTTCPVKNSPLVNGLCSIHANRDATNCLPYVWRLTCIQQHECQGYLLPRARQLCIK